MKVAAIYSRKSKFTDKGESIDNQIKFCKEYCKSMGIEKFLIYEDEGFSGKNINRPQFKKMLIDANNKIFDTIVCYKLDRISRNIADFSSLINKLDTLGINFISINEKFDTSTPIGRAMMYISSIFAQLERETIGERVRDNMLELSKSGRWLGGQTPLGYESKSISVLDKNDKKKNFHILSPIQSELEIVKLIFSKYNKEKSISKVQKYLIINNIKTKMGSDWTKKKIQLILKNPLYVKADENVFNYLNSLGISTYGIPDGTHGLLTYNKTKGTKINRDIHEWIVAISWHKGIITSEMWLNTQKLLEQNKTKAPRLGTSHTAILTGVLKCSLCGSNMLVKHGHISEKTGKRILYYVCTTKDTSNRVKCNNPNIRVDELEMNVINKLNEITKDICIDKKILLHILNNHIKQDNTVINKSDASKEIHYKEFQIDNLLTQLSNNPSLSDYILAKISKLKNEIQIIKENQLLESQINDDFDYEQILNKINNFEDLFEFCTIDDKKAIIRTIINKIYWNGETGSIEIEFKK